MDLICTYVVVFGVLFVIHNMFFLRLTETIFGVENTKKKKIIFGCLAAIIGTVFLCLFGSMSSLGYVLMLLVYTAMIGVYFKGKSITTRVTCILTFNIHIMVARAICSSVVSIITGKTILEISQDMQWFWAILILTTVLSTVFTAVIIKIVPAKYLKAMTRKAEQMAGYIAICSVANIYLIFNGSVYVEALSWGGLMAHQIIVALAWLFAMYVGMFMMVGFDILRDNKDRLEEDLVYREAILNRALSIVEIDCINDKVLRVLNRGKTVPIKENMTYSQYLQDNAISYIHPQDFHDVIEKASIKNILKVADLGKREFEFNYRVNKDSKSRWLRSVISINNLADRGKITASVMMEDIHEMVLKQEQLKEQAEMDPLVKLYNKATVESIIKEHLSLVQKGALFLIDLDNFKGINDNMGHAYGDKVLKEIAEKISACFRKGDIIGRIGGDEFIVFLKQETPEVELIKKGQKICESIIKTYKADNGVAVTVSCSIGIALAPQNGGSFKELYKTSDIAMYQSKNKGKNTFTVYNENMKEYSPKEDSGR